ncbi:DUF5681 domain-containing protein [Bradyrhizobium sp. USDA 3650]
MSTDEPNRNGAAGRRRLPPQASQFKKGQSGNPAGRPKGAVSPTVITRKFALKKVPVTIRSKRQLMTRLDVAFLKLKALAADGSATAAEELSKLRARITPNATDQARAYLVVPEPISMEEFIAREEERNRDKVEPSSAINLDAEEFIKAARGEPTIYGQALLAYHRKYSNRHE